jgi:hypothetical protein
MLFCCTRDAARGVRVHAEWAAAHSSGCILAHLQSCLCSSIAACNRQIQNIWLYRPITLTVQVGLNVDTTHKPQGMTHALLTVQLI